jgi:RNA polymerase sigma-70 factor (ECF subfamily)
MTEQEMISGVINRDREALTTLVTTYQKKVIKTAYYFLGNMEDAEDLAQDVFLKIVESLPRFRHGSSLSTWIYRITVNYSLNAVKKNKQKRIFLRFENVFGIGEKKGQNKLTAVPAEQDSFNAEYNRYILWKMVSSLPEKQRKVFILNKYEDIPYKEIAEITGHSLSAVESLMHRARHNLQKKLMHNGTKYYNYTSDEMQGISQ